MEPDKPWIWISVLLRYASDASVFGPRQKGPAGNPIRELIGLIVCMTVADAFDGSERDMSRRSMSIKRSELPYCSLVEEYCCDSILPSNYNTAARQARLS